MSCSGRLSCGAEGLFEGRDNFVDGAVPKDRKRSVFPSGAWRKEKRLVPVKSFLDATIRLLAWLSVGEFFQLRGYEVLRVPELADAIVRESGECAAARRAPISREDRLPDDQHTQLAVVVTLQKLFGCGGPPQAGWSSG